MNHVAEFELGKVKAGLQWFQIDGKSFGAAPNSGNM